jgi:hypothetical protein
MMQGIPQANVFQNIGPFSMPNFSSQKVQKTNAMKKTSVEFGGSVPTTAPVVNSMFLKPLTPQVATSKTRLNVIA